MNHCLFAMLHCQRNCFRSHDPYCNHTEHLDCRHSCHRPDRREPGPGPVPWPGYEKMITVIFLNGCFYIDEILAVDDVLWKRSREAAWRGGRKFQARDITQEV